MLQAGWAGIYGKFLGINATLAQWPFHIVAPPLPSEWTYLPGDHTSVVMTQRLSLDFSESENAIQA